MLERGSRVERAASGALVAAGALLAAGGWWWLQLAALRAHRLTWAQDLAFFNQIFFNAAAGREWTSPLLLEPVGFFEMVHFHPLFVLLVPLYWLFQGPEILLLFNCAAVAAAAWPLAKLGEAASGRAAFGAAAGLAYLLWVPAWSGALADFRPMSFLTPGFALVAWGVCARRWAPLVAGAAICCGAREESSYLLAFAGAALLVLPFGPAAAGQRFGWRRKEGLALLGLGLGWFGFLLAFKANFFFHFDPRTWLDGARDAPPVDPELAAARLRYIRESFLGGYLLAPLSPAALLMSAPPFVFLQADAQREWQAMSGLYVHLRAPLIALWAVAGTAGAGWLARRYPRLLWPLAAGLVVGNLLSFRPERAAMIERARGLLDDAASPEVAALDRLIDHVGPEDRVATDYRLIAALSGRRSLWATPHLYAEDARPPYWTVEWPLTLDRVDTLLVPVDDPTLGHLDDAWVLEAAAQGYQLWRRTRPPEGGFPAPIP